MCAPSKHWNSIRAFATHDGAVKINAMRSDGLLVQNAIMFERRLSDFTAVEIFVKTINEIESYRNCECNHETKCKLHEKE